MASGVKVDEAVKMKFDDIKKKNDDNRITFSWTKKKYLEAYTEIIESIWPILLQKLNR